MEEANKQKIVGALVVAAALIIFLPSLFDEPVLEESLIKIHIPAKPRDLNIADFDVIERSAALDKAHGEINALREQDKTEITATEEDGSDSGSHDLNKTSDKEAIREVVNQLVKSIKEATGQRETKGSPKIIPAWTVQLASFIEKNNALNLRESLRRQQERAYIKEIKTPGGIIYRVYVGPMLDKENAKASVLRLNATYKLKGMVVSYVPE